MAIGKKKILWIAGGAVLAVFVLIILVLLVGVNALKPRIESTASKALGMDVRIGGGLSLSLLPVFGASAGDVSVSKSGADVARAARLRIGLKLLPLIRGRVTITELELVKPVLSIVRLRNGHLNIETEGSSSLTVNKLSVSQGTLSYADLMSGQKIEMDGVDLTAADLVSGGAAGADPLKTLSFAGDIKCRTIKAGGLTLTDLAVEAAAGKGVLDITRARVKLFGGTGSGTLHGDFRGPVPDFKIAWALHEFKIQGLLGESGGAKRLEGPAEFSADLTARGKTRLELMQTLGGRLSLTGENLELNGIDIDGLVAALEHTQAFNLADVGGYLLAGPLGAALSRGYNFAGVLAGSEGGKGIITKLVSVWKVERGTAEAVDVAMATKKHRIAVKGGLNFVGDRYENIDVAVLDERGCAAFSQKIHGLFARPQVDKVSTLKSLAGPLANLLGAGKKLSRAGLSELGLAAESKPCSVPFYSGSVADPAGRRP